MVTRRIKVCHQVKNQGQQEEMREQKENSIFSKSPEGTKDGILKTY